MAPILFPVDGEDDVVAPVLDARAPRTRRALIGPVTGPTALVFPVERRLTKAS